MRPPLNPLSFLSPLVAQAKNRLPKMPQSVPAALVPTALVPTALVPTALAPTALAFSAAAVLAIGAAPSVAAQEENSQGEKPQVEAGQEPSKGEIRLAKMLEGRTPGEAKNCIRTGRNDRWIVIDGTALVFKHGRTLYVNVPRRSKRLDSSDTMVSRRYSSYLCRTDIITTIDQLSGMFTGQIFLGDFIPYRKTTS